MRARPRCEAITLCVAFLPGVRSVPSPLAMQPNALRQPGNHSGTGLFTATLAIQKPPLPWAAGPDCLKDC